MPYVTDPGDWSQWVEELAIEQAEVEFEQYICRCPRCDGRRARSATGITFGLSSSTDGYLLRTGYHCACIQSYGSLILQQPRRLRELEL